MAEKFLGLPYPAFVALVVVYIVLLIATLATAYLQKTSKAERYPDLNDRLFSWWLIVFAFTFALILGRVAVLTFLGFISFLALKEFLSLIPTRRIDRATLLWVYLTIPIQYYFASVDWYGMFIVFIPVWSYLFITMTMVVRGETAGFLMAAGTISWGLMITVFALSHLAFLFVAGDSVNSAAGGAGLLFFLLFLTQFNDVAQYVWGKWKGRRKLAPSVSPAKTLEGFLGGVLTTTVIAGLAGPWLTNMPLLYSLIAGAIIAVAGFIGDLTMSALKRDLGVKDTSSFLPGHGGVLDRVDSLTYAAPVFAHYYRFFFFP